MNKPKKPEVKPISGIYLITNIINNKHYVGSSNDVNRRLNTHKRELKNGSSNNLLMQREYNEFGESNFLFEIIDKNIPEEMLTAYERVYCYIYDSFVMYKGYNTNSPTSNHKLFKEAYNCLLERGIIK